MDWWGGSGGSWDVRPAEVVDPGVVRQPDPDPAGAGKARTWSYAPTYVELRHTSTEPFALATAVSTSLVAQVPVVKVPIVV